MNKLFSTSFTHAISRLAAFALLALLPAFGADKAKADLTRIVAVGDSIAAGFQSFSLFDANTAPFPGGQQYGFAAVVAHQAGRDLTLPLFNYPGVPANFFNPALAPLYGRTNPGVQATNLAVPGFTVANAIVHPFPGNPANGIDAMSSLILGTPQFPATTFGCGPIQTGPSSFVVTELGCAIALRPTTLLVSLGANDALQALTLGLQPTNSSVFALQYATFLGGLASTGAKVVVTNIPDLAGIPYLVPVPLYPFVCGIAPPAGATPADFVVANLAAAPGPTLPVTDLLSPCKNPALRTGALVKKAQDAVKDFNRTISQVASQTGAVVVDLNALFATLTKSGYKLSNGKVLTTSFGGGLFSLDGIHPTNTGYAILAKETIATMNQKLQTSIPQVNVDAVAATDPLVQH